MPKAPSLKRNFIMNTILTASSFLFPLITFPYVSRVLFPEGNGKIAFASSMVSYFSMVASLGIPTYGIRACAQIRDDQEELSRTVQEIFIINAAMTILAYISFFIAINTVSKFQAEKALFLIYGSTIFFNLLGIEWLYKALEQYQYITVRSILFKLISVILMFLLVHTKNDYVIYGGITIFAGVGSNVLNFLNIRRYISIKPCRSYRLARHCKPIFVFFALSVAATIYTHLDTVMLGFISGDEAVGYYSAAVKVKNILTTVVTSLGAVLLPRISYYVENNLEDEYMKLIEKAFDFVILSATPLCVYFIFMAKESILFLSGGSYLEAIVPMQVIMPTVLFIGLTNIIGIQLLVPRGKENLVFYSTCVGAIIDIILNAYFIPRHASTGAAIGTLAAELAVLITQLWFIRSNVPSIFSSLQLYKVLIALVVAALVLFLSPLSLINNIFFRLVISSLCFFSIYGIILFVVKYRFSFR